MDQSSQNLKKNNIEKSPKPFRLENKFYVPLARLFAHLKLNGLCDKVDMMRELMADTVKLNHGSSAVKGDLHNDDDDDDDR